MGRKMSLEKAEAIVSALPRNKYNVTKTLEDVGYTRNTAQSHGGKIANNALRTVSAHSAKEIMSAERPLSALLQRVGMSEASVIGHYRTIIDQNKDLTNKLKALVPLLKELGVVWDDKPIQHAPTLNLTVKEVFSELKPVSTERLNIATDFTSHNIHSTTQQSTANLSPSTENGSTEPSFGAGTDSEAVTDDILVNGSTRPYNRGEGFDFAIQDEKEGERPIQNFVENSTIDTQTDLLHNNISQNEI